MRIRLAVGLLFVAVVGSVAAAQAPFAGRTVTILVGNPPGGGYDRFARLVARHLPRYLPGSPAVVVQNMPGAGGIVAANHLYNVLRTDGYTLGLFNRNLVIAQLAGVQELRVDMRRWHWLGNLAGETYVFAIRADLPYRHVLDLRRAAELSRTELRLRSEGRCSVTSCGGCYGTSWCCG